MPSVQTEAEETNEGKLGATNYDETESQICEPRKETTMAMKGVELPPDELACVSKLFANVPREVYGYIYQELVSMRTKHPYYRDDQFLLKMLCDKDPKAGKGGWGHG